MDNAIEPDEQSLLMRWLDSLYTLALSSPELFTSEDIEKIEFAHEKSDAAADSIIRNHIMMAAATGFVSNIGGLITLPLAIPANIAGVTTIQFRMFQQICRAYRVDPENQEVRTFAMVALLGSAGVELVEEALAVIGTKLTTALLTKLPGSVISAINRAVGFRLVTKFGTEGVVNLSRWIPLASGIICASVDGVLTYGVGEAAKTLVQRIASDVRVAE